MRISTRARYGVRLMLELGINYGKGPLYLRDIARNEEISEKYLSQIIIPLKASGLVQSVRGAHGGYYLHGDPAGITLREIVEVLEGDLSLVECVNNPSSCSRISHCVTQELWGAMSREIARFLDSTTLGDLVRRQKDKTEANIEYAI